MQFEIEFELSTDSREGLGKGEMRGVHLVAASTIEKQRITTLLCIEYYSSHIKLLPPHLTVGADFLCSSHFYHCTHNLIENG